MSEPVETKTVDPIAFTKERMAEIGEVWKSYAMSKKSEALSKVEDSMEKAPPQLKKLLGIAEKGGETVEPEPQVGN